MSCKNLKHTNPLVAEPALSTRPLTHSCIIPAPGTIDSLQAASHVLAHELLSRHWDCLGHHERHTYTYKTDFEFRQRTTVRVPVPLLESHFTEKKDQT